MNPTIPSPEVPLHILLRRRREELKLLQSDVAEALRVRPECVGLWEAGRRRMELCKIPRLAAVLQIDPQQLCAKALAEFHPAFYITLFGDCAEKLTAYPPVQPLQALRCDTDSVAARNKLKSLLAACESW